MYWLGRVVGLSDLAARLSAIVFAWSGYSTTLSLHPHTNVFVLLPSFCAAALLLSRGATVRRVLAAAGLAALLTAGGHPETLFVGVISVFVFVYLNREKPSRMGFVLAGAFAGFLLIAVQIVPFLLILWNSHARVARATELPAHFRTLSAISLVLPGILGSPLRDELDLTGAVPNAENFVARSGGYVGALCLLAILVSFRQLPAILRRGIAIGAAGLLLSWWIPGIRDVLRLLPVVRWIAFDCFVIPFAVFASLAAGPALMLLADANRKRWLGLVLILCGTALVLAGASPSVAPDLLVSVARSGIEHLQKTGHLHQAPSVYLDRLGGYIAAAKWTAIRRALFPGFCWLAFGGALLSGPSRWRRRVMFAAAVGELAFFGYGFAPSIRTDDIAPRPPAVAAIEMADPERRWLIAGAGDAFPANLGTTYQLRQIDSYDVLTSEESTRQLMRAGYDPFFHAFPLRPTETQLAALASMGVRFWIGETGVTELVNPQPPAPPPTGPPRGFGVGLAGTALGIVLLFMLVMVGKAMKQRIALYGFLTIAAAARIFLQIAAMPPYAGLDEIQHVARLVFVAQEHRNPTTREASIPPYLDASIHQRPDALPSFSQIGERWPEVVRSNPNVVIERRLNAADKRPYASPNYEAQQPSIYYSLFAPLGRLLPQVEQRSASSACGASPPACWPSGSFSPLPWLGRCCSARSRSPLRRCF